MQDVGFAVFLPLLGEVTNKLPQTLKRFTMNYVHTATGPTWLVLLPGYETRGQILFFALYDNTRFTKTPRHLNSQVGA